MTDRRQNVEDIARGGSVNCLFLHQWTKWSEPFTNPMIYIIQGQTQEVIGRAQRRACLKCNAVQERII